MSKQSPNPAVTLRTYPVPCKGALLLACRKCQKKLKRSHPSSEAANIKKALRQRTGKGSLRILQIPCLKLCPKDAVAVCTQQQLAQGLCSIVRTPSDLDALCAGAATPQQPTEALSPGHPRSTSHGNGRFR